jgi:ribosomal protein S12 methylthiotransferase accessory factor
MATIEISYPGGVKVDVSYKGHTLRTDQPVSAGGENSAMAPFDVFLASIAGCMGFYALRFCQERQISIEGLRLTLNPVKSEDKSRIAKLEAELALPGGFPAKYHAAILRAMEHCSVKQHILTPPEFEVKIVETVLA